MITRAALKRDVLVLCYHAVSESWTSGLAVTPQQLSDQLELLLERGYRGATFYEAVHDPPHPKTLAVTFDDSYRSVRELGQPVLERLGLPGTVFVPTAYVGSEQPMSWPGIERWVGGEHQHELVPMSWPELEALAQRGWEIGSHTRTHPRLTELDDIALAQELEGSRSDCETTLGLPCRSLAYPFGDEDERVIAAAGRAGYLAAGALPSPLLHAATSLRWPRIAIHGWEAPDVFPRKVSPARRRLRAQPWWRWVSARHQLRRKLAPGARRRMSRSQDERLDSSAS